MPRPKKPADERRTETPPLRIRATVAERAAWAAAAGDQPEAAWAREILNRAAKRKAKDA